MKKNLLFIMNNLTCGGAEKALISLLETIDYSSYNVDLFLFKHEGLFFNKIPSQVNLLEEPVEYKYFDMSAKGAVTDSIKKGKINTAINRIQAGFIFKNKKNESTAGQRVWKYISRSLKPINKKYDVAIGYLQTNPIYFCIDKVNASRKIGFVHSDYEKLGLDPEIDMKYFHELDRIVTVSEECANILKRNFPMDEQKVEVMHNIISPKIIKNMSLEVVGIDYEEIKIVSVGRLNYLKGFDLAVKACRNLVEQGYSIKWIIVGDGEERDKLEKLIVDYNLQETFILLGMKENPYPYVKEADIYIQPSRSEGKSIAVDEAKILCKPIVITDFETAKDQINNRENGLIVGRSPEAISEGIKKLIDNEDLRKKFSNHLSQEKLGTESEIQKFYELIKVV